MAAFPTPYKKYEHQDDIDATCGTVEIEIADSDSTLDLHELAERNLAKKHLENISSCNRKERRRQQKVLNRLMRKTRKEKK